MEYCTLYERKYKSGKVSYGYREKDLRSNTWTSWKVCPNGHGKLRREAETWVGMRNADLKKEALSEEYDITIATSHQKMLTLKALLEWDRKRAKAAESTRTVESYMAKVLVEGLGEDIRASELTAEILSNYIARKQREEKKPRTINSHLQMLKAALNRAVSHNKIARLPVKIVTRLPQSPDRNCSYVEFVSEADAKPMQRALTQAEASVLLETIMKHDRELEPGPYKNPDSVTRRTAKQKLHDTVSVLIYSGLRKGEVFGMRWKDVDLKNAKMTVTMYKGGKPRTDVLSMSPVVEEILRRRHTGTKPAPAELIFGIEPADRGKIRNGKTPEKRGCHGGSVCYMDYRLRSKLKRYARLAGIERWDDLRIHDLRHTFCTEMAKTVPLDIVKRLARHKNIETTLRYIDKDEDAMRAALATLTFSSKIIDIATGKKTTEAVSEETDDSEPVSLSCHFSK